MQFKKFFSNRGQAMVLYVLLIPMLFLFVGVGIDLGWYFLNVSRLQNAADAAALAGAWKIIDTDPDGKGYDYYASVLANPPTDLVEYDKFYVWNGDRGDYTPQIANTQAGKTEAIFYANKNLYKVGNKAVDGETEVTNQWIFDEESSNVTITTTLYGKSIDKMYEEKNNTSRAGTKYYEVELIESIQHLFLRGLDPMQAKVVSYVILRPHDKSLVESVKPYEEDQTIQNWEYQNYYHNFTGKWNHYQDTQSHYKEGDDFRTEIINVKQSGGSGRKTSANGNNYYSEDEVDSINIDFKIDSNFSSTFSTNWDLRTSLPQGVTRTAQNNDGWKTGYKDDLRIIGSINFSGAWKDRNLKDLKADVLWTRIEADPIWSKLPFKNQTGLNSVRQMILNVSASNTATAIYKDEDSGKETKYYTQRPFFIFYMGPETNNDTTTARESQPVILNLYEDWNAILYMPNSPVIINGNGHKLTGFVIAKEYHRLKTADDFISEGYVQVTDEYGYTLFVKQENLVTRQAITDLAIANNYDESTDSKGNVTLKTKVTTPKRLILTVSKDEAKKYSSFTNYINATYRTKFMAMTGLSDSEVSNVTFPQDENKCTEAYTVATADLSTTKVNDDYVKVFVGTDERYIDKKKLPYIRVRRDAVRPYVSVYDFHSKKISGDCGVNTIDTGSTLTAKVDTDDIWIVASDPYKNDKYINKTLMEDTYYKYYVDSVITFVEENGIKYFQLGVPEDKGTYRKVTDKYGDDYYIKEDPETEEDESNVTPSYYMQTLPNGSYKKDKQGNIIEQNPIIISNKGDLQSVQLNVSEVTREPKDPDEIPKDRGEKDRGEYRRTSTANRDKDYRIPEYERVYKAKEAFNLSEESCYSYFQIEDLVRVNYLYMNVDELNDKPEGKSQVADMFFTTKRASWID